MKTKAIIGVAAALGLLCVGCTGDPANPYLTLAERMGASGGDSSDNGSGHGGGGSSATTKFRDSLTITFNNYHPAAELNTSMVAWVELSSVSTADQQEDLINDGYVQLAEQLEIGTAYTLPVGTYVYYGPGTAGSTPIMLARATGDGTAATASSTSYTLMTPDVILVYAQPPVSCESVAFFYTDQGMPLPSGSGATGNGGLKTLAQVSAYQCDPFQPGLFVRLGGGTQQDNEFLEGENIGFSFYSYESDAGDFCRVTIGS